MINREKYLELWDYLLSQHFTYKVPPKSIPMPNYSVLDDEAECGHFLIDRSRGEARFFVYKGSRLEKVMTESNYKDFEVEESYTFKR